MKPDPLTEFTLPGRRKTDHPLVVGTIVLCLGITTVSSIFQVVASIYIGKQVSIYNDAETARDKKTESMRDTIIKSAEAQANILRRVCLNVAKTDKDQGECLTLVPPITQHEREAR